MEKTYYIATLIFAWFITISLVVFSIFAFKLSYYLIGSLIFVISLAAIFINTLLYRNVRKQPKNN